MAKIKERLAPSKKMVKPGKKVAQRKYAEDKEEYDRDQVKKVTRKKGPADIAEALEEAKEGYSKKPKVKPSKKGWK